MTSKDIVIRTERTLNEIVIDIEGKITNISLELQEFKNSVSKKFSAQQKQLDSLTAEIRVINERITSVNDRLASKQYTLRWGVSFVSVMLVALPLVWGLRKFFSFSIRDAIREAVREELAQHTNQN